MNKIIGFVVVLIVVSLVIFDIIIPLRNNLKNKKEKQEEKEKQKNKKIFERLFNFSLEDENLSDVEKAKRVNDVLKLFAVNFYKVANDQTEIYNYVSNIIKKDFFDGTIIDKIALKKFFILYPVNWGLGFSSLDHLRIFINLIVAQKKSLFWQAYKVAKYFGYYVNSSIKTYYF